MSQQKGLQSNRLIVNVNAPIHEIKIIIDNRYEPAEMQVQNPQMIPAPFLILHLQTVAMNLQAAFIQGQLQQMPGKPAEGMPDLPPAPTTEKPS